MKTVSPSYFKFYTDISGVPNKIDRNTGKIQDVVLAMTSISKRSIKRILSDMEKRFPRYWDKKGHQLQKKELEIIINYLNRNNVIMLTINFETKDWIKYRTMYPQETHLGEKVMSILYFFILKYLAKPMFMYESVCDNDTNFGIHQSIVICKRLLNMHGFDFDITLGHRDINPELRLPDWVAQARRKIPLKNFEKYEKFFILKNKLYKPYRNIVFKSD